MDKSGINWIIVGSFLGFLAVLLGAAGSHWFSSLLSDTGKDSYTTAFRFHAIHTILILIATVIRLFLDVPVRAFSLCPWFLLLGIIFFSGSLYVLPLSGISYLGIVAPVGGLFFMLGWLSLAYGALKVRQVKLKGGYID